MPIKSIHPIRQSILIDFNDIFFTNFADLNFGMMDGNRTSWDKVKTFPKNVEMQVAAVFTGRPRRRHGHRRRGNTVIIHYGIVELPDRGYRPPRRRPHRLLPQRGEGLRQR